MLALLVVLLAAMGCRGDGAGDETSAASAGSTATAGDWPLFRGNLLQNGVATSDLPEAPELLWTFDAGADIESTAAIRDGVVYVGSYAGKLHALSLEDGAELWAHEAQDEIKSSPSVFDGVVYYGDEAGIFHAVDANTGEPRWQFETYAGIISGAAAWEDRILFGSYDNTLYSVDRATGELVWKVETDGYVHGTPAVFGELTTVSGCDGYLWLIQVTDGTVVTKIDLGGQASSTPAVVDRRAFVGTFENEVLGLDLESRQVLWRYEHPTRKFPFYASAAATPEIVVIGGRDKYVHGVDPDTGEARWTYSSGSRIDSSAVIVGDRAFLATNRGEVLGLDLGSGEKAWSFDSGSAFTASPAVASGRLVISSLDGVVYCFG